MGLKLLFLKKSFLLILIAVGLSYSLQQFSERSSNTPFWEVVTPLLDNGKQNSIKFKFNSNTPWFKSAVIDIEDGKFPQYLKIPTGLNNSIELKVNRYEIKKTDRWTCSGEILGIEGSSFVLSVNKNSVSFFIYDPETNLFYKSEKVKEDYYSLEKAVPDTKTPIYENDYFSPPRNNFRRKPQTSLQKPSLDQADTPIVDLGVIWTTNSSIAVGGDDVMLTHVDNAVYLHNLALENSGAIARWNLVYTAQVSYVGSEDPVSHWDYLTTNITNKDKTDSILNKVELNSIDHITLIQEPRWPEAVGLGSLGYSVVSREGGFTGNYQTMIHEWGHGMNLLHSRQEYTNITPEAFNFGFVFDFELTGKAQTVMSNQNYPSISRFSNITHPYMGVTIGVPAGTVDAEGNEIGADAARYINEIGGPMAAEWRMPGLTVVADRKFVRIPPEGVQEFTVRFGNTANQTFENIKIVTESAAGNYTIISVDDKGQIEGDSIVWNNIGSLGPGEVGNATVGEPLHFAVRVNPGEWQLFGINFTITANSFENSNSSSYTNLDSSLANIEHKRFVERRKNMRAMWLNSGSIQLKPEFSGFNIFDISGKKLWEFFRSEKGQTKKTAIEIPPNLKSNQFGFVEYF